MDDSGYFGGGGLRVETYSSRMSQGRDCVVQVGCCSLEQGQVFSWCVQVAFVNVLYFFLLQSPSNEQVLMTT